MDGVKTSMDIRAKLKAEVEALKDKGVTPCLTTILVGENPASKLYLRIKHKACSELGIASKNYELPEDTNEDKLVELINKLNEDKSVHGILVQLPLPRSLNEFKVVCSLSPDKDVDGLHPYNVGCTSWGKYRMVPCTPLGVMVLLNRYGINVAGKNVVIINRSTLVGKPLRRLLIPDPLQMLISDMDTLFLNADATVTVCHSKTEGLKEKTREADIVVSAVGQRPSFILTGDYIKEGAVVIDVGQSRINGKLYGDSDFESVAKKASYITPVPGGVGPMTVTMLLYNTLLATSIQTGHPLKLSLNDLLQGFSTSGRSR
ncbi:MAG: bifunctional 5,10-methylenetetrahydrofolate dehydrogenase/5,10-methenyltetrahydrofolate cyclohydrolase [Candidatus Nezhaarchaeales archaeon]